MSGPVTSVARVEDVQIFLKDPVYIYIYTNIFSRFGVCVGGRRGELTPALDPSIFDTPCILKSQTNSKDQSPSHEANNKEFSSFFYKPKSHYCVHNNP